MRGQRNRCRVCDDADTGLSRGNSGLAHIRLPGLILNLTLLHDIFHTDAMEFASQTLTTR
ncbi:MAG: hypothetical protein JJU07_09255 [Natronohydrobacter sp.]|nr:hypothetical protein [Natronohydrobacter sp.]